MITTIVNADALVMRCPNLKLSEPKLLLFKNPPSIIPTPATHSKIATALARDGERLK